MKYKIVELMGWILNKMHLYMMVNVSMDAQEHTIAFKVKKGRVMYCDFIRGTMIPDNAKLAGHLKNFGGVNKEIQQCSDSDLNAVLADVMAKLGEGIIITDDGSELLNYYDVQRILSKYFN